MYDILSLLKYLIFKLDETTLRRFHVVINAIFFVGELTAGFLSGSMGLVADSLDMLADALVYSLSLAAVGGSVMFCRTRCA